MKKTKALILALCAVVLVAVSVMGTLAYLTDSEEVVNTFTVGNVDIKLDETDVDEKGEPIQGAERVKENEYHLIPGGEYVKDPTVTVVKGSEEAYLRLFVTISDIADLKAVFGNDFLPENYVEGWDKAIWNCAKITDNGDDTVTYEFRYHKTVDAYKATEDVVLEALFTKIKVPAQLDGEELKAISEMKVTVVGNAIQKAGFDSADAAWTAFDSQVKP